MILKNITEKKRMTFIFAGFYVSAAILLVLIFTIFWDGNTSYGTMANTKNPRLSGDQELKQIDKLLQEHLAELQYLDKKFAALLIDSGIKANFDTTFNQTRHAELIFSNTIDSISNAVVNAKNIGKLNQIIFSYKSALENRKPIDDMQKGISAGSKQIRNDQQALLKFKNDLLKKDSSLSELNEHFKSNPSDRYAVSFPNSDYKLLKNENKYLKSELQLMEAKFAEQRNAKDRLTEENEAFANLQMNEQAKSSNIHKPDRGHIKTTTGGSTKQQ